VFAHAGILFAEMLGVHLKQQPLEQAASRP
jgi:hypothetical protein